MWLTISTRPDIFDAVRSVARYCSTPKAIHWKAALGILAYINGTSGFGITYQRETSVSISLEVFADADYASKKTDPEVCVWRSNYVWRCMCMLIFQDVKMCHTFDV